MKKNNYMVGDIVKVNVSFLGEPSGVVAYVYDIYQDFNDKNVNGISIITENGTDLGGFSYDEQKEYLSFVKHTNFHYPFKNVIQLDRDFDKLIKPLFK